MNAANSKSYEVSLETSAGLERRLTVRVPNAEIERAIAARLAQVGKTAKLKGFRPGKVPQKVVRQYYGGQVRDEVMTDVIRTTYSRAIAEKKLNPAGGPRIEPLAGRRRAAATSTSPIARRSRSTPSSRCKPLDELAIDVPSVEVEEPDLDAMIEKLRSQRATWADVERGAAEGDRVTVDFAGTIDGEPFEGGQGKGIGDRRRLRASLEGLRRGAARRQGRRERDRDGAVPAGLSDEEPGRQDGACSRSTSRRSKSGSCRSSTTRSPTSFGLAGGAGSLRGEVRNNMERELKERLRAETKTRAFDALIGANRIVRAARARRAGNQRAASATRCARWAAAIRSRRRRASGSRASAQRRVTVGLLIQELLREHKIKLDQARVEQRIKELAAPYEKPDEAAQFYRSDRGMMAQVEASVLEDQVVDFLLSRARCTTKSMTLQGFHGRVAASARGAGSWIRER